MNKNLIMEIDEIKRSINEIKRSNRSIGFYDMRRSPCYDKLIEIYTEYSDNGRLIISADEIKARYFEVDEYDIFISHSSRDAENVCAYAEYLQRKERKVFVDSMLWGNYKDVVGHIVKEYGADFNETMASLHIILVSALSEAIEKSRYFLFVESENSMHDSSSVLSPWVYHELNMAHKRKRSMIATESAVQQVSIRHNVANILNGFKRVNLCELEEILGVRG